MRKFGAPDLHEDSRFWSTSLMATLALAEAMRLLLIAGGGQNFWPDEARYHAAGRAVAWFSRGNAPNGWRPLIGSADHLFFKILALPAAWAEARWGESPRCAAVYISLFSVAALALLGSCVRSAGGSRREAWLAVFFGTCANSLFYYSRHLFPYDVSLAFCLGALAQGLQPYRFRRSVLAGILAGLGFLTYNGYWLLGGVALAVHGARGPRLGNVGLRLAAAGFGLGIPLLAAVLASRSVGTDLVASFRAFSSTVDQGDFGKGYAFVGEYLWSAEGCMLIVWLGAAAYAGLRPWRRPWGRPHLWLLAGGAVYAGLVVSSDVLQKFVVYGRTARMAVPFFCLATGWTANELWARFKWGGFPGGILVGLCAVLAAINFARPLSLTFDPAFKKEAERLIHASPTGAFRIENARWLRPGEPVDDAIHAGQLLLYKKHPLQFEPYLFEGYTAAQRRYLTTRDLAMRLERVPAGRTGRLSRPGPVPDSLRWAASWIYRSFGDDGKPERPLHGLCPVCRPRPRQLWL